MKITIEIANETEAQDAIRVLSAMGGGGAVQQAAPAAPAPAPAAPAPAPAPAAPAAAPAPAPAAPAPAGVTRESFAQAVQAYAKANGPKAAKAKFAELGYGKISDVPDDQLATAIAAFQ